MNFTVHVLSLDPVRLIGEFQFNLQSLKEIKVSDSFLGLNVDSRKCQNIETNNDCKTKVYIPNMTQVCGCLPLSHIMSEEVCYTFKFLYFNWKFCKGCFVHNQGGDSM